MRQPGSEWSALSDALDRLLAGEREGGRLCEDLNYFLSLILETILEGIKDPSTLSDLPPRDTSQP